MTTWEQWNEIAGAVTDRMKDFTRPFVTPLVHEAAGERPRIGSGTYIDLSDGGSGDITLLTCEHVARYQPQQHKPYGSEQLLSLSGVICADRDPVDTATVKVGSTAWSEQAHEARSLSISSFAPKHGPVKDELIFFRGLAGSNCGLGSEGILRVAMPV